MSDSSYPRLAFVSALVQQLVKTRNLSFVYQGEALSASELADPHGFLPVFLEIALNQMAKVSHQKWSPAVNYLYRESSICYLVPLPQVLDFPVAPFALFMDFAVEKYLEDFLLTQQPQVVQAYKSGVALSIPLDGLVDNFMQRYQAGKLKVFATKPPVARTASSPSSTDPSAPEVAPRSLVPDSPPAQLPPSQAQNQAQS